MLSDSLSLLRLFPVTFVLDQQGEGEPFVFSLQDGARIRDAAGSLRKVERLNRVNFTPWTENKDSDVLIETAEQLRQYFAVTRNRFDVKLDFKGTEFQKNVWEALLTIPFGDTKTYGEVAQQIGRPTDVRAVGAANGRHPIAIIAPCHCVIGTTGALTGFAGGLKAKELLLAVEGRLQDCGKPRARVAGHQAALGLCQSVSPNRDQLLAKRRAA